MKTPFMVAELSANHNGSAKRAHWILEAAAESGANAIKLQTFEPHEMAPKSEAPECVVSGGQWDGRSLFSLYQEGHTPREWHKGLFSHAKDLGLVCFSSPFSKSAVDFLETLDCPIYKIASFELTDLSLIEYAASTKKPIVISTGMATHGEITQAVHAAKYGGCPHLTLLHCVSNYPCELQDAQLYRMLDLAELFEDLEIGLSDHSAGGLVAMLATAMGATMIEKHLTLARSDGGLDSAFSMEPAEFADMVASCRLASVIRDGLNNGAPDRSMRQYRRGLYLAHDVKAGDAITEESLVALRPCLGAPADSRGVWVGMRFDRDVARHTPFTNDLVAGKL
jgi:N-acetylneuraminate synthase